MKMRIPAICPDQLHELIVSHPEDGRLTWRKRDASTFKDGEQSASHVAAIWNAKHAGRPAFNTLNRNTGYRWGGVCNEAHYAHRVIWAMNFGVWPNYIDHINGIRDDNRLVNLRSVTALQNSANIRSHADSRSQFMGVSFEPRSGRWVAQVNHDGIPHRCGTYSTAEDAARARDAVATVLRGGFAKLNFPMEKSE